MCAVLTAPVLLLAMVPPWQFTHWQWASLALAAPVAVWGAFPLHRAAWANLRHGTTTMDTLVSTGVVAAFGWSLYSLYSLFLGSAGFSGHTHTLGGAPIWSDGTGAVYLEVAATVTTLVLAGRYAEARARRRSGAALRGLLALAASDAVLLRDEREERVPADQLAVGDRIVVRAG